MGDGAWGGRTASMFAMVATREVSQFIAWLKAIDCREGRKQRAHTVRGERRAAWEAGGGERPQRLGCGCARGGAHPPKHATHVCDAGRVPAERLVEGLRLLPRVASTGARGELRVASTGARGELCTMHRAGYIQGADCRLRCTQGCVLLVCCGMRAPETWRTCL